ncbi:MAG: ParA family protein, partial [SAR202 cluster bacterium]|nr:ParA family protein [SAR202 cluster bacterium]
MKTLAVISHKGGAGKTSTTVMLAEEMARRGLRVALVDADRQKGAGLLLGIEQPSGTIQQTQNPKLCYLCSAGIPLRELPTRAAELQGAFDVVLVDTPSLDDPLARAWLQYTQFVLLTIPVEPISIRTLDGADAVVQQAKRMNRQVHPIGLLPTMYDESDATQRQLLSELLARRAEEVLAPAIPHDPSLAHRAEQREERRTEPLPTTRQAYQQIVDHLARGMALEMQAAVPFLVTSPRRAPAVGAPPLHRTPAPVGAATAAAKPAPSNRPAR